MDLQMTDLIVSSEFQNSAGVMSSWCQVFCHTSVPPFSSISARASYRCSARIAWRSASRRRLARSRRSALRVRSSDEVEAGTGKRESCGIRLFLTMLVQYSISGTLVKTDHAITFVRFLNVKFVIRFSFAFLFFGVNELFLFIIVFRLHF